MTINLVDGSVYRRCGCRDRATGRQVSSKCPRLTDPAHGHWYFAVQVSRATGRRTRVRPSTMRGYRDHVRNYLIPLLSRRWTDIDLDAATLTVHEQIVVVDGQDLLGPPKSASSRRTIALDQVTVGLLRVLWRRHRTLLTATGRNRDGYVFVNTNGRRLRQDYLTRRLRTVIAESGLPPVRLHDLRHGAASLALAAGVDLKVVQEMLGHSSIITTADIYTSVLAEAATPPPKPALRSSSNAARSRLGRSSRLSPARGRPKSSRGALNDTELVTVGAPVAAD